MESLLLASVIGNYNRAVKALEYLLSFAFKHPSYVVLYYFAVVDGIGALYDVRKKASVSTKSFRLSCFTKINLRTRVKIHRHTVKFLFTTPTTNMWKCH